MAAIEQINKGAQQSSAAAQQSGAGVVQIEQGATLSRDRAKAGLETGKAISDLVQESRTAVEGLIAGVSNVLQETNKSSQLIASLEQVSRRIDKIVDAIT